MASDTTAASGAASPFAHLLAELQKLKARPDANNFRAFEGLLTVCAQDAALAAPAAQEAEPVCYWVSIPDEPELGHWFSNGPCGEGYLSLPLYAHPPRTQAAAQEAEPVAWRHSHTHCLYETREEVELADGDEWAEPLYARPQRPQAAAQEAEPAVLPVAAKTHGAWDGLESLDGLPDGTELYAHPPRPQAAAQEVEPDFWTICAKHEGGGESGWVPLPGYSNETRHGVAELVLQAARKEGYTGTVTQRLAELGWEVRPAYLSLRPQADAGAPMTVPEGWRLVPVEPTGVMKDCGAGVLPLSAGRPWAAGDCYRAMLEAAPQAPAAGAAPQAPARTMHITELHGTYGWDGKVRGGWSRSYDAPMPAPDAPETPRLIGVDMAAGPDATAYWTAAAAAPTGGELEAMREAFDWEGYTDQRVAQRAFAVAVLARWGAAPAQEAADAARHRAWRRAITSGDGGFLERVNDALQAHVNEQQPPTEQEWDAAIDAARARQEGGGA